MGRLPLIVGFAFCSTARSPANTYFVARVCVHCGGGSECWLRELPDKNNPTFGQRGKYSMRYRTKMLRTRKTCTDINTPGGLSPGWACPPTHVPWTSGTPGTKPDLTTKWQTGGGWGNSEYPLAVGPGSLLRRVRALPPRSDASELESRRGSAHPQARRRRPHAHRRILYAQWWQPVRQHEARSCRLKSLVCVCCVAAPETTWGGGVSSVRTRTEYACVCWYGVAGRHHLATYAVTSRMHLHSYATKGGAL